MSQEIERKWLVKHLNKIVPINSYYIVQGYVFSSKNECLRIRQTQSVASKEYKYYLTVKSGSGIVRNETETEISAEMFDKLYPLTEGKRVRKNRNKVILDNGLIAEVDLFTGLNQLVLVEVEFTSEEEANNFIAPDWFGEDVTHDSKYINANLVS
jgi:CYTH domain-containing protein